MMHVLITGGAGFLGSHVARRLIGHGMSVRILDNLSEQVHGGVSYPDYLPSGLELLVGDVRDRPLVETALDGIDAVVHLAAAVGVGQSMYEAVHYTSVNELGTATLLQAMADRGIERLVCASSMSIYGEGEYHDAQGHPVDVGERDIEQLRRRDWEPRHDGRMLIPVPTTERKVPSLSSIYALNKFAQERMCLTLGRAYDIPTVALRFFNIYGRDQALSNPYTGVLAIFASRILNGKPPLIFEDGQQRRDFVHVSDAANACSLALTTSDGVGGAYNIGSGVGRTVLETAHDLATVMGRPDMEPRITGKFRAGDIRHCFADISKARAFLGYEPRTCFEDGLADLADWLRTQAATDRVEQAMDELHRRGLVA